MRLCTPCTAVTPLSVLASVPGSVSGPLSLVWVATAVTWQVAPYTPVVDSSLHSRRRGNLSGQVHTGLSSVGSTWPLLGVISPAKGHFLHHLALWATSELSVVKVPALLSGQFPVSLTWVGSLMSWEPCLALVGCVSRLGGAALPAASGGRMSGRARG